MKLLLVNGGLRGAHGDSAAALAHVASCAATRAPPHATAHDAVEVSTLVLADLAHHAESAASVVQRVRDADALVLATGTVWSGPSSVMTRFLEVLTPHELEPALLGKPVGVVVTMDSVGGMEAGARLLSTCSLLGFLIPPCALVVLSRVAQNHPDVWSVRDLPVLVDNVCAAVGLGARFRAWDVERARALDGAYPAVSSLDLALPRAVPEPSTL